MDSILGDLPATLFSPAKMAYIAYILLAALKIRTNAPWWEFFVVTIAFLVIEVFHNDYLRIRLNRSAENHR